MGVKPEDITTEVNNTKIKIANNMLQDLEEIDWRKMNRVTKIKDRTFRKNPKGENMYCSASYSTVTAEILEASYSKSSGGKLLNFSSAQIRECSSDPIYM